MNLIAPTPRPARPASMASSGRSTAPTRSAPTRQDPSIRRSATSPVRSDGRRTQARDLLSARNRRPCGKHGVTIGLEALNRFECYLFNTMADLSAHLDEVDHPHITGMYDTFHANIEEADPIAAYRSTSAGTWSMSISPRTIAAPRAGHIDWPATFARSKRAAMTAGSPSRPSAAACRNLPPPRASGGISLARERLSRRHQANPQGLAGQGMTRRLTWRRSTSAGSSRRLDTIAAHAEELTALDQAIGDADHGLNMKRGFDAVLADLPTIAAKPLPEALKAIGTALVMKVGGASGPLYGTLFMTLGKELPPIRIARRLPKAMKGNRRGRSAARRNSATRPCSMSGSGRRSP